MQRHYFANKGPSSQGYGFSSSHVWMWELDCEESWALKNWCIWTVMLEKTLESPLDCRKIQPVHSEGDQSLVFFGRNDNEGETPVLWPPHEKSWLIGKAPDAGRDWGQEEKGTTEDEMAGWHHWLDGRESEWTLGVGDGVGGLACCDSWGCKELDLTEQLNWTELNTVESFGIVNKAEKMFFWNSLAFSMIRQMLSIWSLVPLRFLKPAWTSRSSQSTCCWSLAWKILSITLQACEMSAIVW